MMCLFVGRFQPLHNGHLQVILSISKRYDLVKIGVGSTNKVGNKENPFDFATRKNMIDASLSTRGVTNYEVYAIDDIDNDEQWAMHVCKIVGNFDAVYTGNERVERLFKNAKKEVHAVEFLEGVNATKIRKMMDTDEDWKELVPKEVHDILRKVN